MTDALDTEIAERNRIRRDAQLPHLSLEVERERAKAALNERRMERLMHSPLKTVVERRVLARMRVEKNDLDWQPSGVLSGGRYLLHARARSILLRFARRYAERFAG